MRLGARKWWSLTNSPTGSVVLEDPSGGSFLWLLMSRVVQFERNSDAEGYRAWEVAIGPNLCDLSSQTLKTLP
jgi:hypothetical protein